MARGRALPVASRVLDALSFITDIAAARTIPAPVLPDAQLEQGLFGDCKPVGDGVLELRIDVGPGYRTYLARAGSELILLICGGDKRTQTEDIKRAKTYWKDYQARTRAAGSAC